MTGGHNKDPKNQVYPISIGLTSSVSLINIKTSLNAEF